MFPRAVDLSRQYIYIANFVNRTNNVVVRGICIAKWTFVWALVKKNLVNNESRKMGGRT